MAVQTHLFGWNVNVVRGKELHDGELVDTWTLFFDDTQTRNQIVFAMNLKTRNELIRQLTGGLVLGGEIPQ
jgi:hypothetical protein